jgi:hypothetical protein
MRMAVSPKKIPKEKQDFFGDLPMYKDFYSSGG